MIKSARRHAVVRARDTASHESSVKRFELAFRFVSGVPALPKTMLLQTKQNMRTIRRFVGRLNARMLIAGVV